ncbi:MAG: hypothetical protein AAFP19_14875, partial [Bacteroidota bacterium]
MLRLLHLLLLFSLFPVVAHGMADVDGQDMVKVYLKKALRALVDSPKVSIQHANEALALAEQLEYEKGMVRSLTVLGNAHYYLFQPEVSLQYLYRALDQAAGRFPTQQVR